MKEHFFYLLFVLAWIPTHAQNDCVSYGYPFWSQPDELYRGRLKVEGMSYGNPYTLMDRRIFSDPNDGYKAIRTTLMDDKNDVLRIDLYKVCYDFALQPMPSSGGNWERDYSRLAIWAKFNAFVFVIGIDPYNAFQSLDVTDPSGSKRDSFALRTLQAFNHMDYRCPSPPLDGFEGPVDNLQFRCRELQYYLEAYDWLKGANADPDLAGRCPLPPYDEDRNSGYCSPRYRLRLFARNFYIAAKGILGPIESPTGWKRNHGIMSASAIGMAGIVLNDAGVEADLFRGLFNWIRPAPNYSPVNWYRLGLLSYENLMYGIHIPFFADAPQTNHDGSAGFAEGPSYFAYAFSCMIPFLRAQDNLSATNTLIGGGFMNATWREPFYERFPFNGLFKWAEQAYTGEYMPSYDNSMSPVASLLGLTGNKGFRYGNIFLGDAYSALYPDYIAVMATPTDEVKEEVQTLTNSGNTYIRAKDQGGSQADHFFHMLHETGLAVDKPIGWGGTHEDDDFSSLSLFVQKDLQLAIDPPYFGWEDVDKTNKYDMHNTFSIKLGAGEQMASETFENPIVRTSKTGFSLYYNNKTVIISSGPQVNISSLWQRQVNTHHLAGGELYYLLNDYVPTTKGVIWRLNGNGLSDNGTYSYNSATRQSTWSNPCSARSYQLLHFYAGLNAINYPISRTTVNDHSKGITALNRHTRLILEQNNPQTIIQSVLIPHKCSTAVPKVSYDEQPGYVATTVESVTHEKATLPVRLTKNGIDSLVTDTVRDLHIAQMANLQLAIPDPFKTGNPGDTLIQMRSIQA